MTEEAEGQGAGSRGSNPCPEAVKRSGTWVSSPALLGRSQLVGVQAPSNHPPCSLLPAPLPLLTSSIINPVERPEVTQNLSENFILTTVDDLYNWAKMSSLYPLMFGTACCFMEFMAAYASRFDMERYGMIPRATPRQADLMITAGTITMKYAPNLVRLYEQMPEPKYVIAMGACTITGGMFSVDSPSAVRGVDKLIPVDVYIPGCPPRPEAVIDAIIKLRKKIANESIQELQQTQQTHRYHSITHQMKVVEPILDGQYLRSSKREVLPPELTAATSLPLVNGQDSLVISH